jgi:cell division protein FtsL
VRQELCKNRELKTLTEKKYNDSNIKSARRKKDRSGVFKVLGFFAAFVLVVYSIVVIISQGVQIQELRDEKEQIDEQISEAKQLNDEYTRLLSSEDESEYMERIAVEKLGYAYPNERRFYVVNEQ